jgi:hypothetical protein
MADEKPDPRGHRDRRNRQRGHANPRTTLRRRGRRLTKDLRAKAAQAEKIDLLSIRQLTAERDEALVRIEALAALGARRAMAERGCLFGRGQAAGSNRVDLPEPLAGS